VPNGAWQGAIQQTKVVISASQMTQLAEHPITLIGPPGPGKANFIFAFSSPVVAAEIHLAYNGPSQMSAVSSPYGLYELLGSASSTVEALIAAIDPGSQEVTYPRSEVENQAILLVNDGADFATGDGTVTLTIFSMTVDL
jgi:hypothetical protein